MIAKLLPLVFALVGSGAGVGAGLFLRSPPAAVEHAAEEGHGEKGDSHATKDAFADGHDETGDDHEGKDDGYGAESDGPDYVEMSNQFVIPVVSDRDLASLMILSISLEVAAGQQEKVFAHEPKLRDSFMQVMFDHANMGGFSGAFTDATTLGSLRTALREVAQRDVGVDNVLDVLILEIARQDY